MLLAPSSRIAPDGLMRSWMSHPTLLGAGVRLSSVISA